MDLNNIESLAEEILKRYDNSNDDDRYIILVAGIPGSGKTTLANDLVSRINQLLQEEVSIALPMDGFHLTKEQLSHFEDPEEAFKRRGAPWTFDAKSFHMCLQELKQSKDTFYFPSFDHSVGDPVDKGIKILSSHRLIIVEGNYLLYDGPIWKDLNLLAKFTLFLNCPLGLAKERLIKRHMEAGIGNLLIDCRYN
ncbi:P-loop containing nucleoside triphosphate hydrolase protein [Neoconidiobolus thromboides FSU 785]|nr:P-loop containing nucleoside triphosphate hydrolase protein [Neoconidiobolus thromboides FSU 785]